MMPDVMMAAGNAQLLAEILALRAEVDALRSMSELNAGVELGGFGSFPDVLPEVGLGEELPGGGVVHPFRLTYNVSDDEVTVSPGSAYWWNRQTPGFDRQDYSEETLAGTGYVMAKLTVAYATNVGTWSALTIEATDLSETDNEGNIRYFCIGYVDPDGTITQKVFQDIVVWGLTGDGSISKKEMIDKTEGLTALTDTWEHAVDAASYGGLTFYALTRAAWDEAGADQKFYAYYRKVDLAADGTIAKVYAEERVTLWDFDANEGDIWYRGSSGWTKLAAPVGFSEDPVLRHNGTAPYWDEPSECD